MQPTEGHSRKDFLRTCSKIVLSGFGLGLSSVVAGCPSRVQTGALSAAGRKETPLEPDDPALEPAYLRLHRTGELKRRGQELWGLMKDCELCPRQCGARRTSGDRGFCGSSSQLEISAYHPHFGEERPLVGTGGSGTVFFTGCGLRCVFCINWEISQGGQGRARRAEDLADMMLRLQATGCHNINIVTPTHYSPHLLLALDLAASKGLRLPLVYNTSGFERTAILRVLDGVVDIYLPDFKYADGRMAEKYSSGATTYPEATKAALLEMHRQVGVAKPARDGLIRRGLMIRHLVMPNGVSGTRQVVEWIATHLPKDTYVNIMSQYRPVYKASDYAEIARPLKSAEYADAVRWAREAGLTNLDIQGFRPS